MSRPLEDAPLLPVGPETEQSLSHKPPPLAGSMDRRRGRAQRKEALKEAGFGWALASLSLLIVVVFTALPIVASFVLAFFKWDAISSPQFVGFANFSTMVSDSNVIHSFQVTIVLTVLIIVLQIGLGLLLALLVSQRASKTARTIFRTAFFLPLLASAASISIVMSYIFNDQFGIINYYLGLVHIPPVAWLGSNAGATATIVLVAVWQQLGFTFILFVAALNAVPTDVIEAARMDGVSSVRLFFSIKLPLISPTVLFATVVGVINAMQLFDQPYVMTKGGPGDATKTTVLLIYQAAFQNQQFGYASAISVVLFLLLLVVTALQFAASRRLVFYS
jgi:multiple sugar transport system permease protein